MTHLLLPCLPLAPYVGLPRNHRYGNEMTFRVVGQDPLPEDIELVAQLRSWPILPTPEVRKLNLRTKAFSTVFRISQVLFGLLGKYWRDAVGEAPLTRAQFEIRNWNLIQESGIIGAGLLVIGNATLLLFYAHSSRSQARQKEDHHSALTPTSNADSHR